MASLRSTILSIRTAIIISIILTLLVLQFQKAVLSDSSSVLNSIENSKQNYLVRDNNIAIGLEELDKTLKDFSSQVLSNMLDTQSFNQIQYDIRIALSQYIQQQQALLVALKSRQDQGYGIHLNLTGLMQYAPVQNLLKFNPTYFDKFNTSQYLNTTLTGGVYPQFSQLVNDTGNVFTTIKDDMLQAFSDFALAKADFNIQKTNIDGTNGVLDQLNSIIQTVSDNNNITTTLDANYSLYILTNFENINTNMLSIYSDLGDIQDLKFGTNSTTIAHINQSLAEFNQSLLLYDGQIQNSFNNLNGTVLGSDVTSMNDLYSLYTNSYKPDIMKLRDDVVSILLNEANFNNIRYNQLLFNSQHYSAIVDTLVVTLRYERNTFSNDLNTLQVYLKAQIDNQINIISTWLLIILLVFLAFIAIVFILTFRTLSSKFNLVSSGDLSVKVKKGYRPDEMGQLEKGFDKVVTNLKGIISALQAASERVGGIAEELAAGAEEASASIKVVSDTIREFSGGASEQNILINRINEKLTDHLVNVERASNRIGETSSFVLKVAKRTNILGLNASIEAAKAGKFGLGFNVVAEEVRNLSESTKASASRIANLIEDIQYSIRAAVEDILNEVSVVREVAENTAAGSEEVSAATLEQVTMMNEISQTASELSILAQELNDIIRQFNLGTVLEKELKSKNK